MRSPLAVLRRGPSPAVRFCESCGEVCDLACRVQARRDRLNDQAITYGLGLR